MKQEIEAKFLRIDLNETRARLKKADAKLTMPMTGLRRAILETPEMRAKEAFIRVRDEGDRITATYKQHAKLSIGGANEVEIVVDDFKGATQLFEATGLTYKSYQETKRETWNLKGVTITLDLWPWLDPLIEIEAETEQTVKDTAVVLGFDWKDAVFGGVMIAYQSQYPDLDPKASIIDLPKVEFDRPLPDMLK